MTSLIEVDGVSKRYGDKLALDDVTFTVIPGAVTGFLGPNGAGKSTAMRIILGLDRANAGTARVNGKAYHDLTAPLHEVGAMLDARAIHPGRSAYGHLLALAQTHGIGRRRVGEMLDRVGLSDVARKRVGGFSLGMEQRLGIAAALLGDPQTLILDEPANGLDPDGIRWIRELMLELAAEGRTVFVSSHLMSEIALTAERLIVIGRGRLIADTTAEEFIRRAVPDAVRVRAPDARLLAAVLRDLGAVIGRTDDGALLIHGLDAARIGDAAAAAGVVLHELTPEQASLEDAFMRVTHDVNDHHATAPIRESVA